MNSKCAVCLCVYFGVAIPGCIVFSSGNGNNNDNSSQSESRDFSGFSSFSYSLTENGGPFFAPAEGVVGSLRITRTQEGEYAMDFSVGDGEGGLVEASQRLLSENEKDQMLTLLGDVTLVTVPSDAEACEAVGITAFSEDFDWDGEAYDRVSTCFAPTGISLEYYEAITSFLGDLVGQDGTMRK